MTRAIPTTVVFCGPSINADAVRTRLTTSLGADPGDALVTAPPVAQGDVITAVRLHRPHTLVIIDGVFDRVPAVWHKELLWAMDSGIHLFGSSSMGALRAAELHPFGMIGVGRIFEQFRDGMLEDDDEVAITHTTGADDFRALSTAMVDLRHHLTTAVDAGVLTRAQADHLVQLAKDLPYPQRAMPTVLGLASSPPFTDPSPTDPAPMDAVTTQWLREAARDPARSRKRLDALECLDAVATHLVTTPGPFRPEDWYLEPTVFLTHAIHEAGQTLHAVPTTEEAGTAARDDIALAGESPAVLRKQALLRVLARDLASLRGIRVDEPDVHAVIGAFRRRYGLDEAEPFEHWLAQHQLTWPEVAAALTDVALVERVERAYQVQVDVEVGPLATFAAARRATPDRNLAPPP